MRVMKIAFYSPMGGVYRTTTALLTGLFLAEEYRIPTLIIDFDIETPGIYPYLKLDENSANIYESYLAGRLVGEVARYPLSRHLFVIPTAADPTAASHMAYTLGYTLGRTDEPIRRSLANLIDGIISDAVEATGAKIVLIDAGPGADSLTRTILKYLANGIVLLSRADGVSRRRFAEMISRLKKTSDLRLGPEKRYELIRFVVTAIPLISSKETEKVQTRCKGDVKEALPQDILGHIDSIIDELRTKIEIPIEKAYIEPLIPQLLLPNIDNPVNTIWENKDRLPYCYLANTIRSLAKSIGGRIS